MSTGDPAATGRERSGTLVTGPAAEIAAGEEVTIPVLPETARMEGGATLIPVLEEILVVEKRLVLKEDLHLRRTAMGQDVEVPITLRRQHAVVERPDAAGHVTE
ncbi:hypothetical protein OPKNFCMD_1374 [Methylobacterium crusticola]|uniref:DUF2382 domain-containing protein n=1 Tax=Methylobacterium crusticola TaxID=1697972 RepID=A0ABQ4QVG3_9HYPH|nr:DUF2382 domain-containing protein [Methylobacterium crusticola]GJD48651.1 hypothetical protein OPKNFCMD_1374 [Methylobacterium crusticola]